MNNTCRFMRCVNQKIVVAHTTMVSLCLGLCSALFTNGSARAEDWSHWRGLHRNDHSTESSGYDSADWLADGALWEAQLGESGSSPIVVAQQLYDFSWSQGHETLTAIDIDSGKTLWTVHYDAPRYGRHAEGDQGLYSGPSSTPEYDTELGWLFTLGNDGSLRAWDIAHGTATTAPTNVWTVELNERYSIEKRPRVGRSSRRDYGYTSSPLATTEALIVEVGATECNLVGLNKRSGEQLWQSKVAAPAGHNGGPVPMNIDNITCVAVHHHFGLLVVRTDSDHEGETVAEVAWETDFANNIATVAVHKQSVLLTSSYNQHHMARYDLTLRDGATLRWMNDEASKVCSPIIHEGRVYWAWQKVNCVDFDTGELVWSGGNVGDPGSCILTQDERLVVWANRGQITLVETAKRSPSAYLELSKIDIGGDDAWPHVALANGRLFCKDRLGHLVCLRVK